VDLCAGVECPVETVCDGDILVSFLEEGACLRESGECTYRQGSILRNDCAFQGDVCEGARCIAAHCLNDTLDGDETDLNCGGSCDGCSLGRSCVADNDCFDQPCFVEVCAP
jgi:hypothetical protein